VRIDGELMEIWLNEVCDSSKSKIKRKKRNINNDLAILPSHDKYDKRTCQSQGLKTGEQVWLKARNIQRSWTRKDMDLLQSKRKSDREHTD